MARASKAFHRVPGTRSGRNPRATPSERNEVLRLAYQLATQLDPRGRAAVLLAGSWARGDAHEASDIDLWVVGGRSVARSKILERGGHMVSVKFSTVESERREMRNLARLDGSISGWRSAKVLHDSRGIAVKLKLEARRFRWSTLRRARETYLADQLAGWAEEVAKLLRALETGEKETASVQRNLLANAMGPLRVLSLERLSETENGRWENAGRWAGPAFRSAQRTALGTQGASWAKSCEAALRLYSLTAMANLEVLRGEKRSIVVEACRRAGYPIARPRPRR